MSASFADIKSDYTKLWAGMKITPSKIGTVTEIAQRLIGYKTRYQAVEKITGVPWFVIAVLHQRESGADFKTYLGNGQSLARKTTIRPTGRGPFSSWDSGAIDALKYDRLDQVDVWTVERAAYEIEKFNGFGYRNHGIPSPYLWSFSNQYKSGKYVSDGDLDWEAVDLQCGCMPLLARMMELDSTIKFGGKPAAGAGSATVVVGSGGFIAQQIHSLGGSPAIVIAVVIATAIVAIAVFYAVRRIRTAAI